MKINKLTFNSVAFPDTLRHIPSPPKRLFVLGMPLETLLKRPCLAIVGSRKATTYGRQVTERLARELAEQGVVIVSGLALGIDSIAHRAALEAGGSAIAVLPGPVDKVYPATNRGLAEKILAGGGTLISEYDAAIYSFKQNFIARNRLVAGLSRAVLITEAAEKSGSLYTARFALEQGKDVLAVPGNITVATSVGTNNLIRSGATPITSYLDVLQAFGLESHATSVRQVRGRNAHEQTVLDLLLTGLNDGAELLQHSRLSVSEFNQALTMLEIGGKVRPLGGNRWAIR